MNAGEWRVVAIILAAMCLFGMCSRYQLGKEIEACQGYPREAEYQDRDYEAR